MNCGATWYLSPLPRRGIPGAGRGHNPGGGTGGRGVEQCVGGAGAEPTGQF